MVKSRASKPSQSARRKMEAAERIWSNQLNMWHVCANVACRRARCCRGNTSYCFRYNFWLLPEGVRDWFAELAEAKKQDLPFEEAWERLEKVGLVAEFCNWHDLAQGNAAHPAR